MFGLVVFVFYVACWILWYFGVCVGYFLPFLFLACFFGFVFEFVCVFGFGEAGVGGGFFAVDGCGGLVVIRGFFVLCF